MWRLLALMFVLSVLSTPGLRAADTPSETVVYLKNGSILRGRMVSFVPQTSVSLETRDGNLLVWEMDEVERIESEAAAVATPPVAPVATDPTTLALSDLDRDSAVQLLRDVHTEMGSGFRQMNRGRSIRTWAGVLTLGGFVVGLANAAADDPSGEVNAASWALWGVGRLLGYYGGEQEGKGLWRLSSAYNRLDAALDGDPQTSPESVEPTLKRRYGESQRAFEKRKQRPLSDSGEDL